MTLPDWTSDITAMANSVLSWGPVAWVATTVAGLSIGAAAVQLLRGALTRK